jgi:dienelactone hydrolase
MSIGQNAATMVSNSMSGSRRTRAPQGDLTTFHRETFAHGGITHAVYRKGQGPAVLVIAEMPGISPQLLGFADRVVALGATAVLPDLFGTAGRDPRAGGKWLASLYMMGSVTQVCISKEFTVFATGRSSPITRWLRGLAAFEHARCGGPGVGVVGMCFTGGFALAMAADPRVLAPVLSQPSLPVAFTEDRKRTIDCDPDDLAIVARRCGAEGLKVLGLRFHDDPLVPLERFDLLRDRLGDGFVAVEIAQADGHPDGPPRKRHSVLTVDLIDEPGEPTRAGLDQVLDLLRTRLKIAG